ncbi:hypothetical protein O3M35_004327 [Rhynocoris fuscipes]|uniref:tRNA (carboxymethyluridine(34)-5-O)-methyltransferase n=1 Tax=Rhynocoris fuscipes TaxID=488301 RepID=A0AAW1CGU8_9HEMI
MDIRKRSNLKRWVVKKRTKFINILKAEHNIIASETPQTCIVWCNGGVGTGISKEEIVKYFSKFGVIKNIALIAKKSYCFIEYKDIRSAMCCFNAIQDEDIIEISRCLGENVAATPMFVLYSDKIPEVITYNTFLPVGCEIITDFVSSSEECNLLESIDYRNNEHWLPLKQRRVKHYGHEYVYSDNSAKKLDNEIPESCNYFWHRIQDLGYPLAYIPNQLTVNCYEPGQGIPPHIDTHSLFHHTIYILSLKSDIQMEFKLGSDHTYVHLPRRSLLILHDAARYAWNHGISSRSSDVYVINNLGYISVDRGTRVSFTFRHIRNNPCNCDFPLHCDSRITASDSAHLEDSAIEIETKFVKETYNNIAHHFSLTRYKPWPNVRDFVMSFPVGSLLLDVGCGNGKYFGSNKYIYEVGCELSVPLSEICKGNGYQVINADCLSLPFQDNMFDGVLCIAVIHHLSSLNRRQQAVREILRVLSEEGRALIYVWADQQEFVRNSSKPQSDRREVHKKTLPLKETNLAINSKVTLPIIANDGSNFLTKDVLVPWTHNKEKKTYLRYYHIFGEDELEKLVIDSGGIILQVYHDMGNWGVEMTKWR